MPTGYVVMYRPRRGVPWVELGRAATMFEALAFVNTKGMFWLQTIREEAAVFDLPQGRHTNTHEMAPAHSEFMTNE